MQKPYKKTYMNLKKQIFFLSFIFTTTHTNNYESILTLVAPGFWTIPSDIRIEKYKAAFSDYANVQSIVFPDTTTPKKRIHRIISCFFEHESKKNLNLESDLGQELDIAALHSHVQNETQYQKPFMFFGSCKGASAVINYIAKYNPQNLKALVLEAPFSNVLDFVRKISAPLGIPQTWDSFILKKLFPNYPENALPPIQAIPYIENKDLPILIIHSQEDQITALEESCALYKAFKENGFINVYFAVLKGKHAHIINEDKDNFLKVIHTFYKSFNFKYNNSYAIDSLEEYSIDLRIIDEKISEYKITLEEECIKTQKMISKFMKNLAR